MGHTFLSGKAHAFKHVPYAYELNSQQKGRGWLPIEYEECLRCAHPTFRRFGVNPNDGARHFNYKAQCDYETYGMEGCYNEVRTRKLICNDNDCKGASLHEVAEALAADTAAQAKLAWAIVKVLPMLEEFRKECVRRDMSDHDDLCLDPLDLKQENGRSVPCDWESGQSAEFTCVETLRDLEDIVPWAMLLQIFTPVLNYEYADVEDFEDLKRRVNSLPIDREFKYGQRYSDLRETFTSSFEDAMFHRWNDDDSFGGSHLGFTPIQSTLGPADAELLESGQSITLAEGVTITPDSNYYQVQLIGRGLVSCALADDRYESNPALTADALLQTIVNMLPEPNREGVDLTEWYTKVDTPISMEAELEVDQPRCSPSGYLYMHEGSHYVGAPLSDSNYEFLNYVYTASEDLDGEGKCAAPLYRAIDFKTTSVAAAHFGLDRRILHHKELACENWVQHVCPACLDFWSSGGGRDAFKDRDNNRKFLHPMLICESRRDCQFDRQPGSTQARSCVSRKRPHKKTGLWYEWEGKRTPQEKIDNFNDMFNTLLSFQFVKAKEAWDDDMPEDYDVFAGTKEDMEGARFTIGSSSDWPSDWRRALLERHMHALNETLAAAGGDERRRALRFINSGSSDNGSPFFVEAAEKKAFTDEFGRHLGFADLFVTGPHVGGKLSVNCYNLYEVDEGVIIIKPKLLGVQGCHAIACTTKTCETFPAGREEDYRLPFLDRYDPVSGDGDDISDAYYGTQFTVNCQAPEFTNEEYWPGTTVYPIPFTAASAQLGCAIIGGAEAYFPRGRDKTAVKDAWGIASVAYHLDQGRSELEARHGHKLRSGRFAPEDGDQGPAMKGARSRRFVDMWDRGQCLEHDYLMSREWRDMVRRDRGAEYLPEKVDEKRSARTEFRCSRRAFMEVDSTHTLRGHNVLLHGRGRKDAFPTGGKSTECKSSRTWVDLTAKFATMHERPHDDRPRGDWPEYAATLGNAEKGKPGYKGPTANTGWSWDGPDGEFEDTVEGWMRRCQHVGGLIDPEVSDHVGFRHCPLLLRQLSQGRLAAEEDNMVRYGPHDCNRLYKEFIPGPGHPFYGDDDGFHKWTEGAGLRNERPGTPAYKRTQSWDRDPLMGGATTRFRFPVFREEPSVKLFTYTLEMGEDAQASMHMARQSQLKQMYAARGWPVRTYHSAPRGERRPKVPQAVPSETAD